MSNKYHFCPRCGQQLLTNANFCHNCGHSLKSSEAEKELSFTEENLVEETLEEIPFVKEISDTKEEVIENIVSEELEDEEENPLVSKIFISLISIILIVLFIVGLIFVFKMFDIKIKLPFLSKDDKVQEVIKQDEVKNEIPTQISGGNLSEVIENYAKNNQGDYSKITTLAIDGQSIKINDSSTSTNKEKTGSYDLNVLAKLTRLENLEIANVLDLKFPTSSFSNIKNLTIKNSNIDQNLNGISNITSLESLAFLNTNLTSLNGLAQLLNLKKLTLDNNGLNDLSALSNLKLSDVKITNNNIRDYRPLANSNFSLPGSSVRDVNARQIQVLIDDLNARKTPDTSSKDNIIPNGVVKNYYYYILEEKVDDNLGLTWYRIEANKWIASKEGDWTKIHE